MTWLKRIGAVLLLSAFLMPTGVAQASLTDSEAASMVQSYTSWDALGEFDTAFSEAYCGSTYPCWRMDGWTYMNVYRFSPNGVCMTVNHFARRFNPPNASTSWRVQWRACAHENDDGWGWTDSKQHISGVTHLG